MKKSKDHVKLQCDEMGSVDFGTRMSVRPGDAPIWTLITIYLRRMDRDVNKVLKRRNDTRPMKMLQDYMEYAFREDVEAVPRLLERGAAHLRTFTYILVLHISNTTFV